MRCYSSSWAAPMHLIDCDIVSHQQSSRFGRVLQLFLGSSYANSSTPTLSLTSKSSRFDPTQRQGLKLFLDRSYAISSTATSSLTSKSSRVLGLEQRSLAWSSAAWRGAAQLAGSSADWRGAAQLRCHEAAAVDPQALFGRSAPGRIQEKFAVKPTAHLEMLFCTDGSPNLDGRIFVHGRLR